MKRIAVAVAASIATLAVASAALAGPTTYAGPKTWAPGESAGSAFSASWDYNYFFKPSSGYDTTVTFIDNVSYSWHATVRNTAMATYTYWSPDQVKKGHCRAHTGYHPGSCVVVN
jgi:hypothetical protein